MKNLCLLGFFLLLIAIPVFAAEDTCLECHLDSLAARQLASSAHAGRLECADCHGTDHDSLEQGTQKVTARVCGRCHAAQLAAHQDSRHGKGLHAGWGCTRNQPERNRDECAFCHQQGDSRPLSTVQCARFLKQTTEMGQIGCNRCHSIEESCAVCHGNHITDARVVQDPAVCAKCHMGPDHPQWEAWQTSQHGTLFNTLGANQAPGCQQCHMPKGEHNVSLGLTAPPSSKPYADKVVAQERQNMLERCQTCHGRNFSQRDLAQADAVRQQTLALVDEARKLVQDLDDRGLLRPAPSQRPPHPHGGNQTVLDGNMLYEDLSTVEALYFRLYKYAAAKTIKGAYHQNPAYTHWYGNAEVKLLLSQIKSESLHLQESVQPRVEQPSTTPVEPELERLQKRYHRGEMDDAGYREEKRRILQRLLKP